MGNWLRRLFERERVLSAERVPGDTTDWLIVTNKMSYRGSCTVWSDAKTGFRVSSFKEAWLCAAWKRASWAAFATLVKEADGEAARRNAKNEGVGW